MYWQDRKEGSTMSLEMNRKRNKRFLQLLCEGTFCPPTRFGEKKCTGTERQVEMGREFFSPNKNLKRTLR
jgi:hypothetical protein